jgi:antitoxin component of RelBE/YafQ-DinJ toxin-antitoxin module
MAGKTERLQLRISPEDRAQVVATGQGLGLTLSRFVRTAVLERVALERALARNDEKGGSTE